MRFATWGAGLLAALAVCAGCSGGPDGVADTKTVQVGGFAGAPPKSVEIRDDGNTAILSEDASKSPTSLDGGGVAVPEEATELSFDYHLDVPADNEDYFQFYVGDAGQPALRVGGAAGVYADRYRCDVSAFRGGKTRLVFSLMAGWGDRGVVSRLTLTNLRFL